MNLATRILLASSLFACSPCFSQDTARFQIQMDEVTVGDIKAGWDVDAFIRRVRTDTTFFKAFKGLRVVSSNASNDIRILNKKGSPQATYTSRTRTTVSRGCRTMTTADEKTIGDFYKRDRTYRYFTAELYAYLF